MFLPFHHYKRVKNKYCIAYFGNHNDYILLLKFLRPYIERQFNGTQIYIACKDESFYLLQNEPRVVKKSEFDKNNYCYVRYLTLNMTKNIHPIYELLVESDIKTPKFEFINNLEHKYFDICANAILPNKSITDIQKEKIISIFKNRGLIFSSDRENCHLISVENEIFTKNILSGIKCTLIDTGLGSKLYKLIFPSLEIISI